MLLLPSTAASTASSNLLKDWNPTDSDSTPVVAAAAVASISAERRRLNAPFRKGADFGSWRNTTSRATPIAASTSLSVAFAAVSDSRLSRHPAVAATASPPAVVAAVPALALSVAGVGSLARAKKTRAQAIKVASKFRPLRGSSKQVRLSEFTIALSSSRSASLNTGGSGKIIWRVPMAVVKMAIGSSTASTPYQRHLHHTWAEARLLRNAKKLTKVPANANVMGISPATSMPFLSAVASALTAKPHTTT
mmetsp:Transcript_53966/g.92868  ORF Transcript_53966/g.92868 Transcript_53966/m.92868 type:complete len:250 (+) Transcript_53966:582-1331(+)